MIYGQTANPMGPLMEATQRGSEEDLEAAIVTFQEHAYRLCKAATQVHACPYPCICSACMHIRV